MDKMYQRERSAVIMVSSIEALVTLPGQATYSSTKRYLNTLGMALYHENKSKMDCYSYQLGLTATTDLRKKRLGLTAITPSEAAKAGLSELGNEFMSHGFWKHDINSIIRVNFYFYRKQIYARLAQEKQNTIL